MRTLLRWIMVSLIVGAVASCSSTPTSSAPKNEPAKADAPPALEVPPGEGVTADDVVPDFRGFDFNKYPMKGVKPRIVEISIETHRTLTYRAQNKDKVLGIVRAALADALKKSNITVVDSAPNKINFDIKDCRNQADSAYCIAIDAVFKSQRFELEVGGFSHNGYATETENTSHFSGDITRAYHGAINAVMERLNKQLEIVGMNQ